MTSSLSFFQVDGATGDYHTNLSAKKDALVRHLTPVHSDYSFGFLHVKAVDDAGHDKNRGLKALPCLKALNCYSLLLSTSG